MIGEGTTCLLFGMMYVIFPGEMGSKHWVGENQCNVSQLKVFFSIYFAVYLVYSCIQTILYTGKNCMTRNRVCLQLVANQLNLASPWVRKLARTRNNYFECFVQELESIVEMWFSINLKSNDLHMIVSTLFELKIKDWEL